MSRLSRDLERAEFPTEPPEAFAPEVDESDPPDPVGAEPQSDPDDDFIIQLVDVANPLTLALEGGLGELAASHIGKYLVRFNPHSAEPEDMILTTDARSNAQGFPTAGEAMDMWRTQVGVRPHDGKPNRPLTAYTVAVERRGL